MAQVAMDHRMRNGVDPGRNVAVFRVGGGEDAHYFVSANEPGGLHSEEILHNHFVENGIDPKSVSGIYTERAPCIGQHVCASLVGQYGNAEQQFSLNSDFGGTKVRNYNRGRIGSAMGSYTGPSSAMPDISQISPL